GAGAGAPGATTPAQPPTFASRITQALRDPVEPIIALNIALRLTDDQLAKLQALSGEFAARRDTLGTDIQKEIEGMGRDPDRAVLFSMIRSRMEHGRAMSQDILDRARAVLTVEQWAQLPEEAKVLPRFGGPGGPGGPGGRPRQ
ncbi:MAG TPA: hypothetical protein PKA50_16990, partial [Gemmatimonadales bacterium]|nr:hypothetical protein [Gemmatimonadales bacterium]